MTKMSVAERNRIAADLEAQIGTKLESWIKDSVCLYDMAKLPWPWAIAACISVMLRQIAGALKASDISRKDARKLLRHAIDYRYKKQRKP